MIFGCISKIFNLPRFNFSLLFPGLFSFIFLPFSLFLIFRVSKISFFFPTENKIFSRSSPKSQRRDKNPGESFGSKIQNLVVKISACLAVEISESLKYRTCKESLQVDFFSKISEIIKPIFPVFFSYIGYIICIKL